tara:strand:- start:86 stop:877 length:792 start_codon:yes stop_codon:yes gene_type:complete
MKAHRFFSKPIIFPNMDKRMGKNINGPDLIRVPDWCKNKLGNYYLFFSDHKGAYIRMAFADNLTGPWHMHTAGVLELKDSGFTSTDPPEPPKEHRPPWAKKMKGGYLYAHIASPDVYIDEKNKKFRMYYHGLLENGDQVTRVAVSKVGLNFKSKKLILGPSYFRVFRFNSFFYALTYGGEIWRSPRFDQPFERGPKVLLHKTNEGIGCGFRHGDVYLKNNILYIFYSNIGDSPESILFTTINLTENWKKWKVEKSTKILEPVF